MVFVAAEHDEDFVFVSKHSGLFLSLSDPCAL